MTLYSEYINNNNSYLPSRDKENNQRGAKSLAPRSGEAPIRRFPLPRLPDINTGII